MSLRGCPAMLTIAPGESSEDVGGEAEHAAVRRRRLQAPLGRRREEPLLGQVLEPAAIADACGGALGVSPDGGGLGVSHSDGRHAERGAREVLVAREARVGRARGRLASQVEGGAEEVVVAEAVGAGSDPGRPGERGRVEPPARRRHVRVEGDGLAQRLALRRAIEEDEPGPPVGHLEEVGDAGLLEGPRDEGEVGLAVLHAEIEHRVGVVIEAQLGVNPPLAEE